jgi:hypothetical protein
MWRNASRDSSLGMPDRRRGRRPAWATSRSSGAVRVRGLAGVDRNSCNFFWYGVVAGEGLRSVGVDPLPSSKSVCSILPIARHWRAGEIFGLLPPARTSLLKPAADQ